MVIFEVRKILLLRRSKVTADEFVGEALAREVVDLEVDLDRQIALAAAEFGIRHQLPMADAIIYATGFSHRLELLTAGAHFKGLPGATIF